MEDSFGFGGGEDRSWGVEGIVALQGDRLGALTDERRTSNLLNENQVRQSSRMGPCSRKDYENRYDGRGE